MHLFILFQMVILFEVTKMFFYDLNVNNIVNYNNPGATLTTVYNTLLNGYKTSNKG